jgi:hypothetical protein
VVIDDGRSTAVAEPVTVDPSSVFTTLGTNVNISPDMQQRLQGAFTDHTSLQINSPEMANFPPAIQNIIQAALVDADHNGTPDIMEKGEMTSSTVQVIDLSGRQGHVSDPQARIEKLDKMRASGLISQEQFNMLRTMIEKGCRKVHGWGSSNDEGRSGKPRVETL